MEAWQDTRQWWLFLIRKGEHTTKCDILQQKEVWIKVACLVGHQPGRPQWALFHSQSRQHVWPGVPRKMCEISLQTPMCEIFTSKLSVPKKTIHLSTFGVNGPRSYVEAVSLIDGFNIQVWCDIAFHARPKFWSTYVGVAQTPLLTACFAVHLTEVYQEQFDGSAEQYFTDLRPVKRLGVASVPERMSHLELSTKGETILIKSTWRVWSCLIQHEGCDLAYAPNTQPTCPTGSHLAKVRHCTHPTMFSAICFCSNTVKSVLLYPF